MITINSYNKILGLEGFVYLVNIDVDGVAFNNWNLYPVNAETDGEWDETKALQYLNSISDIVTDVVRKRNVQLISKRVEVSDEVHASDFIVGSPTIPDDPQEAWNLLVSKFSDNKRSIALFALAFKPIVQELRQLVAQGKNKLNDHEARITAIEEQLGIR